MDGVRGHDPCVPRRAWAERAGYELHDSRVGRLARALPRVLRSPALRRCVLVRGPAGYSRRDICRPFSRGEVVVGWGEGMSSLTRARRACFAAVRTSNVSVATVLLGEVWYLRLLSR